MDEPSNTDIVREIRDVKKEQHIQGGLLKDHEQRIRRVENFQIAYEAAQKALAGVAPPGSPNLNKDFVNVVLKFIGLLGGMITLGYLIVQALTK